MMNKPEEVVGICGLFCGICPSYADGICSGCLSDNVKGECSECRHGFRDCAKEHGITWCNECHDFPCQRLKDFKDVHVVNGISHHEYIIEYVAKQRDIGIAAWVKEQEMIFSKPIP